MAFVGAVIGLVGGYIVGLGILSIVLGGGRHMGVRENPSLKIWVGLFNVAAALVGAWLGYSLLSG
jgi:O-antigen/teichoic acid export membrane protein